MKQWLTALGSAALAVIVLTPFTSCDSSPRADTSSVYSSPASNPTPTSTSAGDFELTDNPLKKMSPVYFEETVNETINKFWIKGDKVRYEMEGLPDVYLEDTSAGIQIVYSPGNKTAYKSHIQEEGESLLSPFYENVLSDERAEQDISRYSQQQLEQAGISSLDQYFESWDGKNCKVTSVEFSAGETIKSWVWIEKGITIRYEMTGNIENPQARGDNSPEDTTITMVYELHNFDFGDIPDSMFQVPAGYTLTELPTIQGNMDEP
jgi:hypothetical protein